MLIHGFNFSVGQKFEKWKWIDVSQHLYHMYLFENMYENHENLIQNYQKKLSVIIKDIIEVLEHWTNCFIKKQQFIKRYRQNSKLARRQKPTAYMSSEHLLLIIKIIKRRAIRIWRGDHVKFHQLDTVHQKTRDWQKAWRDNIDVHLTWKSFMFCNKSFQL